MVSFSLVRMKDEENMRKRLIYIKNIELNDLINDLVINKFWTSLILFFDDST